MLETIKMLNKMLETIKKNLNAKMNYIIIFMFAQYFWFPTFPMIKTFLKLKTQIKKLSSLLIDNLGNTSKTTHDLDKVIFNFSN